MKLKGIKILLSLLVVVAITTTSVFAWNLAKSYATINNTKVSVSDANGSIVISTDLTNYTNATNCAASVLHLDPCTTADLCNFYETTDGVSFETSSNYYDACYFAKSTKGYLNVYLSKITLKGASSDVVTNSLRVGFMVGTDTAIFGVTNGATQTYLSNGTQVTLCDYSQKLCEICDYEPVCIRVYVWFEGADASCTNQNIANATGDYSIDIELCAY